MHSHKPVPTPFLPWSAPKLGRLFPGLALCAALTACGGGGGDAGHEGPGPQPPAALSVLAPTYFTPAKPDMARLIQSVRARPGVPVTAIFNPSNGRFQSLDPATLEAVSQFVQAGGQWVGYVSTDYGRRSLAQVQSNIDDYLRLMPAGTLAGIFLDEMGIKAGDLAYYQQLHQSIKARNSQLMVVANPGTYLPASHRNTADVFVQFEGTHTQLLRYDNSTQSRPNGLDAARSAALAHNVPDCQAMQAQLQRMRLPTVDMGWLYFTELHFDYASQSGNPWAALPSYWENMLDSVQALNRAQSLPSCKS